MSHDASSAGLAGTSGDDASRSREAQRATWVSVAINVVLTVCQIAVGLFSHAQSLVADGMHTLSDLLGDFGHATILPATHAHQWPKALDDGPFKGLIDQDALG